MELRDKVAWAIWVSKGFSAETLHQHHEWEDWPVDQRTEHKGFAGETVVTLLHYAWRKCLPQADAAIATVQEAGWQDIATFQQQVESWFRECFPPNVCNDKLERGDRLLEEVLELLQSGDYPPERVAALRDYTWGRTKGEPSQEVGGVMVTLATYCIAHGLEMGGAAETELARISRPEIVAKIRAKQAAKPTGSALPIAPPPPFEGTKT